MVTATFDTTEKVPVFSTSAMLNAITVREILERIGIPVSLNYESLEHETGIQAGLYSVIKLLVPREKSDEARRVLEAESPTGEIFSHAA
jgi:hypothetical protein